ncbi:ATP-binding protein [Streptomyces sp. FXJ1.172]|uniref:AAA family ATPase n=1 Tax=Streptomyces sp. FXJ1.172 TaxID=710705 RepID=UPI0007CFBC68|nr:AAA family ATPase [Streptomyces sp. FXJ1.172]WEO95262.1 ATP-binding protein [Streptomyces sp. FXJ1.172]
MESREPLDPIDPGHPGPEEYGQAHSRRPPRESLTADFGQSTPALARTAQVVCGDLLLTVNPVDGSEIEPCPPAQRPGGPRKRTAAERAETERAARPPVPAGPAQPALSLLERQDERERLVRLLARGRSVRLTGPGGSGRTALLDLVAEDCLDLAPDGVVRLSGFHRTAGELLHDLFRAVYDAPGHRPERDELHALVAEIGAVVVLDDIEFGGTALDELLDTARECAFLIGATPDVPAPSAESQVEEVFLSGLDRAGGVEILERTVGRVLTEEEANWAGDLWFESEGLPLRFVQAGALLRQRDELRSGAGAVDEYGVFEDVRQQAAPEAQEAEAVPLPSLGEAAAPAPLLASRLSASARATLRFAVALGGEVPHQAHLPALVGDTHADAALGELATCGLVSPVGSRYRLAAGVPAQLEAAGYADDAGDRALAAAEHYAWWSGHPSVTPERVGAEADALLAALTAVVPHTVPTAEGEENCAVRLARTAAPAFAAGLHWGAWERALRTGAEASRLAGEVHEQAYFHHELGVLALCGGQLDRARAELEASLGLRGALADKRGTVAGRRALALVADRSGELPGPAAMAGEELPETRHEESAPPPYTPLGDPLVTRQLPVAPAGADSRAGGIRRMARRNLVAAGSGALLAAVLGTVVTLGMTSNENADKNPSNKVGVNPSISQGTGDGTLGADPNQGTGGTTGAATGRPVTGGARGTSGTAGGPAPSTTDPARPSESISPSGSGSTSAPPSKSPKPSGSSSSSGGSTTGTGGGTGGTGTGGSTGTTTGGTGTNGGSTGTTTGGTGTGGSTGTTGGTGTNGGSTGTTGGTTTGGGTTGGTGSTSTGGSTGSTTSGTGGTTSSASASQSAPQPSGTVA